MRKGKRGSSSALGVDLAIELDLGSMVKGPKTARFALTQLRRAAKAKGYTVKQVVNPRTGKPRGNESHEVWALYDEEGNELARCGVTKHPGDMSWKVTRAFEEAFEHLLAEGWMDR